LIAKIYGNCTLFHRQTSYSVNDTTNIISKQHLGSPAGQKLLEKIIIGRLAAIRGGKVALICLWDPVLQSFYKTGALSLSHPKAMSILIAD